MTADFHDGHARWRTRTREQRRANQALVAYRRDLGPRAALHHADEGHDRRGRKIGVLQQAAGLVEDLALRQRD